MSFFKKAQIKLSFGFIISIILIVLFIAAGIYGIKKMLDLKDNVQIKQFKQSLQQDINNLFNSEIGSDRYEYVLPNKIKKVCFKNSDEDNMFFNQPIDVEMGFYTIKNIKIPREFCIKTSKGKLNLRLEKTEDSPLVKIKD